MIVVIALFVFFSHVFQNWVTNPTHGTDTTGGRTPAPPLRTTSAPLGSSIENISFKPNKPLPLTPVEEEKRDKKKYKSSASKLGKFKPSIMLNISAPVNVMHKVHITIDPVTGEFEVCVLNAFSIVFSSVNIKDKNYN
ncbi:unnamed protein product [Schistosoma curassoni]|uniref:CRIB domain-containing protein n=1 Tax=Schistosoma curassoni TaxID=6186 RepID=A0A3P8H6H3_9TREM|nr:unnamed protein product [Schistosoma curassoni]